MATKRTTTTAEPVTKPTRSRSSPRSLSSRRSTLANTDNSAAIVPVGGGVDLPQGADTTVLDLATDTANQLNDIAPTFGELLKSCGTGLANAQRALDASVIDTVNKLSKTTIDVVTDIVQRVDDDTGLPMMPAPEDMIKQKLSVLNFVTPTVHEFKYMALSMDMAISKMDTKTGMSFTSASLKVSRNSAGLFFGFVGVGSTSVNADFTAVRANTEREMQWASGRVQMDALLAPRRTTKFPVPARVEIGPQIFLNQGATTDVSGGAGTPVTERKVQITVTTLTAAGAPNVTANVQIEAPGLLRESDAAGNVAGKTRFTLRRFFGGSGGSGFQTFAVRVKLGQLVKNFNVDL